MRKTLKIRGRDVSVKLLAALIVCSLIGVTAALASIGTIQIGYTITPTAADAPTMTSNPLSLDLGSIPSGSSGTKEFSKVADLTLPAGYEITFTLDMDSASDFSTFDVYVYLYESGETYFSHSFLLLKTTYWNSDSEVVSTGTYDVTVKITYTAETVTTTSSGTVTIDVSYPG